MPHPRTKPLCTKAALFSSLAGSPTAVAIGAEPKTPLIASAAGTSACTARVSASEAKPAAAALANLVFF